MADEENIAPSGLENRLRGDPCFARGSTSTIGRVSNYLFSSPFIRWKTLGLIIELKYADAEEMYN
jgi:hypothetical protein